METRTAVTVEKQESMFSHLVEYMLLLRACLRGGGGPQVGEVTRPSGVTRLSI